MKYLFWGVGGYVAYRLYMAYINGAPSFGKAVNPQAPQGAK